MARRSKRIATLLEGSKPQSKKMKLSEVKSTSKGSTATQEKMVDKMKKSAHSNAKPKLDKLPNEIQQHIYWLAIQDDNVPTYAVHFEHDKSVALQLVKVSRIVQENLLAAVQVWGSKERQAYLKQLKLKHDHDMDQARGRGKFSFLGLFGGPKLELVSVENYW